MAGGTERDEPSFINLDRLLNPGFDETLGWKRTRMSPRDATVTRTRTHVSRCWYRASSSGAGR